MVMMWYGRALMTANCLVCGLQDLEAKNGLHLATFTLVIVYGIVPNIGAFPRAKIFSRWFC